MLILLVAAVIGHVLLTRARIGRYALAIGSSEETVRLSGVDMVKWKWLVYTLAGTFTGLAGVVMAARLGAARHRCRVRDVRLRRRCAAGGLPRREAGPPRQDGQAGQGSGGSRAELEIAVVAKAYASPFWAAVSAGAMVAGGDLGCP